MSFADSLIEAVRALGPTVRQGEWHSAEDPSCALVKGLMTMHVVVELPEGVTFEQPSSPIITVDEAAELYAKIAPNLATQEDLFRPLLQAVIFENDRLHVETGINRLTTLWVLFESIEYFEGYRLKGDAPKYYPGGQALVGRQVLYTPRYYGMGAQRLNPRYFSGLSVAERLDLLAARERDPAEWKHQPATCVAQ